MLRRGKIAKVARIAQQAILTKMLFVSLFKIDFSVLIGENSMKIKKERSWHEETIIWSRRGSAMTKETDCNIKTSS